MPSLKFSVFISSTSEDLQNFREATERGILGLKELYPIDMKHFSPTADNALQVCYDAVQSADMLVGIYALRYGYTPDSSVTYTDKEGNIRCGDGATSITEWEYEWAMERKIPMLLFVLHKDATWDYRLVEPDKSAPLTAFKKRIGEKHTLKYFKDITDYAQAVVIAMNHAYGKILAERMSIKPTPEQIKAQEQHALASSITPPPSPTKEKIRRVGSLPKLFTDEHFYDRANEQAIITNAIRDGKALIAIRGRGGIGKTALACKVLGDFEKHIPPADGLAYFRADTAISADTIFDAFMKFLPDHQAYHDIRRDSTATTPMKTRALLDAIAGGKYVVYIDNLETIQHPDSHTITDEGIRQFIQTVLEAGDGRGLSIIVTTRIPIPFKDETNHLPALLQRYHQLIRLDEGLPVADSIAFMREMDTQTVLPTDEAELVAWHNKVSGFPRGLEALVGYLNASDTHHIEDLLAVDVLEANVLSHIVGVVIDALAPAYHQILAAVAVIGQTTSQADLEYALAPHTDTTRLPQILERLVAGRYLAYNRQSRTYSLHPLDVDYVRRKLLPHEANRLIPEGEYYYRYGGVKPTDENAFTDMALNYRMAEFYEQKRNPASEWNDLPDLQPQLREMDYRFALGDADTTADILRNIDFDYLLMWGYTTIVLDWHTRLEGKIHSQSLAMMSIGNLGTAYYKTANAEVARGKYTIALNMAREQGDREREAAWLGNLGNAYSDLGDIPKAIRHYEEALVIAKERGNQRRKGIYLGNLGVCYYDLDDIGRSIEYYKQAIKIFSDLKDKFYQSIYIGNLGNTLTMAYRYAEAIDNLHDAIEILTSLKAIDYLQAYAGNLAKTYWLSGNISGAHRFIHEALRYDNPPYNHFVSALRGCIAYCANEKAEARSAWDEALTQSQKLLDKSPRQYAALYSKALAVAGLWIVTGEGHYHAEALNAYNHAKAVCGYAGVLLRKQQVLEALVRCAGVDDGGLVGVLV